MLNSWDRLQARLDVADKQLRPITCHHITQATVSASGRDTLGQGSYNPSKAPQTIYRDDIYTVWAGVMWHDPGMVVLGQVTPGVEMGDLVLRVESRYLSLFQDLAQTGTESYIEVDGKTVRPRQVTPVYTEGETSVEARCWIVNVATITHRIRNQGT